jgi:dolichol-phosphate mannosyltransferase
MKKTDLAVIIPVYNEQEIICTVISDWDKTLSDCVENYTINVYNDGSKDETLSQLQSVAALYPNLIIHDKANSGHGSTILKGYRENIHAEWLFQVDSDNEIAAALFKDFWNARGENDFVIGIREHHNRPRIRTLISIFSRLIIKLFYKGKSKDVNVPFRLMKSESFKSIFEQIPDDTFAPNVIVTGYASVKNIPTRQIPIVSTMRETGEVSIKKWKLFKIAILSLVQTITFRFRLT